MTEELIDKQIAMLERVAQKVVDEQNHVPQFKATQEQPHAGAEEKEHEAFSGVGKYFPNAKINQK